MNEFVSKFTSWYRDDFKGEKPEAFKSALKKAIEIELPSRDNRSVIQIRDIEVACNIKMRIDDNRFWASNKDEMLFVGTVRPYWATGWNKLSKHEDINSIIAGFFHFAGQYIARSSQINLIGALNLSYGVSADFRGQRFMEIPSENLDHDFENFRFYEIGSKPKISSNKHRFMSQIYKDINSLDPYINRMIFNFNKSLLLFSHNLDEELITSLDKTINVAEHYWKERVINTANIREVMINDLVFDEAVANRIKKLYELRCYFGAHPSYSKWWDFSEIYELDFPQLIDDVGNIVLSIVRHESRNRKIETINTSWSNWFQENQMVIWETAWFQRIPQKLGM